MLVVSGISVRIHDCADLTIFATLAECPNSSGIFLIALSSPITITTNTLPSCFILSTIMPSRKPSETATSPKVTNDEMTTSGKSGRIVWIPHSNPVRARPSRAKKVTKKVLESREAEEARKAKGKARVEKKQENTTKAQAKKKCSTDAEQDANPVGEHSITVLLLRSPYVLKGEERVAKLLKDIARMEKEMGELVPYWWHIGGYLGSIHRRTTRTRNRVQETNSNSIWGSWASRTTFVVGEDPGQ